MLKYSNFVRKELPDVADEYLEKLEKKGESDSMLMFEKLFVEYVKDKEAKAIERGLKKGMTQGLKQAIKQIAREMLINDMEDEEIMRMTKISKEELEELKNEELELENV